MKTRRIVRWPEGRPWDWEIVYVPVGKPEPAWAARARELKAAGWSKRRIMKELGVASSSQIVEILYK